MTPDTLDLGNGHRAEFTGCHDGIGLAGLIHHHPRPDGQGECAGAVTFRGRGRDGHPEWDVLTWEPLTLSPSLLCRSCGSHGWIKNGKWEEA